MLKSKNLPEALIMALADPIKGAKIRTICYRLKEKGKTQDYATNKETGYLAFLQYGVSGIKFSRINTLFEK